MYLYISGFIGKIIHTFMVWVCIMHKYTHMQMYMFIYGFEAILSFSRGLLVILFSVITTR